MLLAGQICYSLDSCQALFDIFNNRPYTGYGKKEVFNGLRLKSTSVGIEDYSVIDYSNNNAAHIYINANGSYLFTGFPQNNSGTAIWFKPKPSTRLEATTEPIPLRQGSLYGVEFTVRSHTQALTLEDQVLGSMRFIRDRELNFKIPSEVHINKIQLVGNKLTVSRRSLNELADYVVEIEAIAGTKISFQDNSYDFTSKDEVQLKIRTFTSEKPLTPIPIKDIVKEEVIQKANPKKLDAFAFLFYKEKLMAGSPRYFSEFATRDSNYSVCVMMDLLKPEAIENRLTAIMSGMDPIHGLISHEKSEGDFVSWERMKKGLPYKGISATSEDYKMIDGEFAFAITFAKYARLYPERVNKFLDGREARGITQKALIEKLFSYILKNTKNFADNPIYQNLVGLRPGEKVGEWRDSEDGLGGGKYPFDVNAALVPGSLKAILELNPFFSKYSGESQVAEIRRRYEIWNTKVIPLFEIRLQGVSFPALSIDEHGKRIPVMHSDDSFVFAFGNPSDSYLRAANYRLQKLAASVDNVGIPVADSSFVKDPTLKKKFGKKKYHSDEVSWTMVENMFLFGIKRQLARNDISSETRVQLQVSEDLIKRILDSKEEIGGTEVFEIENHNGRYQLKPFAGDAVTNSNQLWSHWSLVFPFLTFK